MKLKCSQPHGVTFQFVPCGKCEECRKSNQGSWYFRLAAEIEAHPDWTLAFATLTYGTPKGGYPMDMTPTIPCQFFVQEDEFVPIPCFDKKHIQGFLRYIREYLYTRSRTFDRDLQNQRFQRLKLSFPLVASRYGRGRNKLKKALLVTDVERSQMYYADDNLPKFIVCAEYGSTKHRPHYHLLWLWNEHLKYNPISSEELHKVMQDYWQKRYGFLFPKYVYGGWNGSNDEKPFVVPKQDGRVLGSAKYVTKYVCKDIEFENEMHKYNLDFKNPALRRFCYFHLQSRQLGFSAIAGLNDSQKLELLLHGKNFAGEEHNRSLPIYLRNKIIYDNQYILEPDFDVQKHITVDEYGEVLKEELVARKCWRRVCLKRANAFFIAHSREIYAKKRKFYCEFFNKLSQVDYWTSHSLSLENARDYSKKASSLIALSKGVENLADFYLSCFGRNPDCLLDIKPSQLWLSRFVGLEYLGNNNNRLKFVGKKGKKNFTIAENIVSVLFGMARFAILPEDSPEAKAQREWISKFLEPNI